MQADNAAVIAIECDGFQVAATENGRVRVLLQRPDAPEPALDPIYDKPGIARRLMTTERSIDTYMRLRTEPIPYSKLHGAVRFVESEVMAWLKRCSSAAVKRVQRRLS
jgi:predicted DNA-binding transcriptional regulator AlpA